ncbi:MAG TPA: ankyrin repeat domain-containing protein, partial [bacterium]|nr:ankyrin repeat domain-containing protein [bacterium]
MKAATPEILKQLIYEKILDTIFIASRWSECLYSVVSEKSKDQKVDVEISVEEISTGLKERVAEFRAVLSVIPTLGSRPKIEHDEIKDHKITDQHEIILNYLGAGKTIDEILSIMTPHNYLLFKCFYQLCSIGILVKGTGAPLSREKVIQLVNESDKSKKSVQHVAIDEQISDKSLSIEFQIDADEDKYRKEVTIYQKLHSEDPDNSIYAHCFGKAESCFIVEFYTKKLSPFAVIGVAKDVDRTEGKKIDAEICEAIKKEGGKLPVRNLIKLLDHRHEIDILTSIEKLISSGAIIEIEPETFIDAIKLGRSEFFEKLFKKNEINKMFSTDISANLTPSMLSVISGTTEDDLAEKPGARSFKTGLKPALYDYEMTYLMLASMIGNYEAVEFLLSNHAKSDLHNGNGVTALMLALQNGYDETALLLMNKGADVNAKNQNNYSALMIAASKGMAHIVDFMIKLKVDVNQLNSKGQSALISALRFNHKDIVLSLIAAGTDLNHKDLNGTLPVDHAESPEMAELIRKGTKNAKQIKEKLNKKKDDLEISEKDLIKKERQERSGFLAVILFAMLMVITSAVNVYLLFFPEERYGFSKESKEVVDQLGMEYCNRFKICRTT